MIIFCPFHSFHPCSLHCFRKASKSCPSSPQRGKEAISNPYSGSHASALRTRSCLCGSRRDARVSRGTRAFRCPGARREEQQQLRSSAAAPRFGTRQHPSARRNIRFLHKNTAAPCGTALQSVQDLFQHGTEMQTGRKVRSAHQLPGYLTAALKLGQTYWEQAAVRNLSVFTSFWNSSIF